MKIAIAGFGSEGEGSYKYWSQDTNNQVTIVDERDSIEGLPAGVPTILGPGSFSKLNGFDLVIRTPSLAPSRITTDGKIWSMTNEFFEKSPAPIIGVTGTKGKGTTSTLITSIFEAAGKKVWLVGNIGRPSLSVLDQVKPDDIVVYELSSFQLWDAKRSPHVAVILPIEPDHLDVHKDFAEYVQAKARVRQFQQDDDICVYHPKAAPIARISQKGKTLQYSVPDDGGASVSGSSFVANGKYICSTGVLEAKGEHNKDNACAAITVAQQFGVADEVIEQGLRNFRPLPHHTELVTTVDGVAYYDDSFSTAPTATVAAIRSFTEPVILILGGSDKGANFEPLIIALKQASNIKHIVLIGQIADKLEAQFRQHSLPQPRTHYKGRSMGEIVQLCRGEAKPGDVVVLSPGCASLDMFESYYERGQLFKVAARELQ